MDTVKIVVDALRHIAKIGHAHPVIAVTAGVLGIIPLASIYCKLTVGMCKCVVDMTGKTVIVTGANTGMGKATAEELAKRGARVILACRNKEKGQKALRDIVSSSGNTNVILKELDLCSFASVRAFAEDIVRTESNLHVLINNAGILGQKNRVITNDGCESIMQCNHFAPFLLTNLLLDKLKSSAPSRIINVSSLMYVYGALDFSDLNSDKKYDSDTVYCRSKMANILFTRELSKRLQGSGVTANSLNPGVVKTDLSRDAVGVSFLITKTVLFLFGKTPLEGAQTAIYLATVPEVADITGKYYADCKESKLKPSALNDDAAARLWSATEKIVGLVRSGK